jgi:hypothetical protein
MDENLDNETDLVVIQAELIAAGYKRIALDTTFAMIRTPDGFDIDYVYTSEIDEHRAIKFAYQHLLKTRHYQAMKTFLYKVANGSLDSEKLQSEAAHIVHWLDK